MCQDVKGVFRSAVWKNTNGMKLSIKSRREIGHRLYRPFIAWKTFIQDDDETESRTSNLGPGLGPLDTLVEFRLNHILQYSSRSFSYKTNHFITTNGTFIIHQHVNCVLYVKKKTDWFQWLSFHSILKQLYNLLKVIKRKSFQNFLLTGSECWLGTSQVKHRSIKLDQWRSGKEKPDTAVLLRLPCCSFHQTVYWISTGTLSCV